VIAVVLAFVVLIVGRRSERWLHRALGGSDDPHATTPPGG